MIQLMVDELDKNKQRVFQVILIFTSVSGVIFAVINQIRGLSLLAAIEFVVALISLWLLLKVIRNQNERGFRRLALIYVIIFFSIMMFAFSTEGVSITIFSWALVIPLASYLLLGVKLGFIITACFYTLSTWIFFSGFSGHEVLEQKVAYANIIICALLFWGISHSYERANRNAKLKLRKLAIHDHLTGLYNRTMMYDYFDQMLNQNDTAKESLALILFDLDKFKAVNDNHGHAAGDEVLIKFSQLMQQFSPEGSFCFRLGGEEFALFMFIDDDSEAKEVAEQIRSATEDIAVDGCFQRGGVSVSAGIDFVRAEQAEVSNMLKKADERLYGAKAAGRNRVAFITATESVESFL
ncbi:GGDEF domain-containing protein [Marinicella marina]|uniref:GGDEF domain-containing protein n=1 Tax=Marinicella marina TaxID=2996016 RepID=UPI0024BC6F0E|nr:GGDEF domain-containing protein [Marinicella marina]MDJ1140412.1 GGDEF domain-containing protein [Marinicella marina]